MILAFVIFSYFALGAKQSRKYQKLLHKIMMGDLTTHEEILKEYRDLTLFSKKTWWK